jgi:DNA-binding transcriptional regulator YdaS (Cro superfamily)
MSSPQDTINAVIHRAIERMGGPAEASKTLGIKPQNFYHWTGPRQTRVAPEHCVVIERETGGEVTRKQLRPDDWWNFWPELPGAAKARERAQKGA